MRVLFTVQPSTGHLHPLAPVAQALSQAGHEVLVASSPSFKEEVEAFGLTHVAAGLDWIASDHSTWTHFPPMPAPGPEFAAFVVTVFADITAGEMGTCSRSPAIGILSSSSARRLVRRLPGR